MAIQDIRNKSKKRIHSAFSLSAVYTFVDLESPLSINVRQNFDEPEDVGAIEDSWGKRNESVIYFVFDLSEVTPKRNAIVTFDSGEEYKITNVLKPIRGYIKCEMVLL